jgi:heme-degrading monooxygenase HmoA
MLTLLLIALLLFTQSTPAAEPGSQPGAAATKGIQVMYRLRVKDGSTERFQAAWAAVTQAAVQRAPGARGSTLFKSSDEPGVFVAIARWRSRTEWLQYRSGTPLNPAAAQELAAASELLSISVLEEIADIGR